MVHRDTKKMGGGFVERCQLRNVGEIPLRLASPREREITAPSVSQVGKWGDKRRRVYFYSAEFPVPSRRGPPHPSARGGGRPLAPSFAHSGDGAGFIETQSWVGTYRLSVPWTLQSACQMDLWLHLAHVQGRGAHHLMGRASPWLPRCGSPRPARASVSFTPLRFVLPGPPAPLCRPDRLEGPTSVHLGRKVSRLLGDVGG